MTAIVLPPAPSWITLGLDTTPPSVSVVAEAAVEPPDPLAISVTSGEPLGPCSVAFEDSLGVIWPIGYVLLDDVTLSAVVGSTEFATGPGNIVVTARDTTCNSTVVRTQVTIERVRVFDATLIVEGAFAVDTSPDHAFEAELGVEGAFAADLGNEKPFDIQPMVVQHVFDANLEITDA